MAQFARRSGGGWAAPATVKRMAGGAWANVANIYRRQGGTWVLAWKAYTNVAGSVSPAQANGSLQGTGPSGQVVTYAVVAAGQYGTGSYTYSWTISASSNGVPIVISSPNTASTYFSRNVTQGVANIYATATCTISDGTSSVAVNVPVSLSYSTRQ